MLAVTAVVIGCVAGARRFGRGPAPQRTAQAQRG
jgi:hypothetical protein